MANCNPDAIAAVLALPPDSPERHWRLLVALAAFKPDADGWVLASTKTVAEVARLHPDTVRKARKELGAAGRLVCVLGDGRGKYTRWLVKGVNIATHPSNTERVGSPPVKGRTVNAPTSANVSTAFRSSADKKSLSETERTIKHAKTVLGLDISIDQADALIKRLEPAGGYQSSPSGYVRICMENSPGKCRSIIDGSYDDERGNLGYREVSPLDSTTEKWTWQP